MFIARFTHINRSKGSSGIDPGLIHRDRPCIKIDHKDKFMGCDVVDLLSKQYQR